MALGLLSCGLLSRKPKGDLIYCSYACRGAAGLGSDYCELIADVDGVPKIVVVLDQDNRFGNPVIKREFQVNKSVVDSLAGMLADIKVHTLNGYHLEEPICGGHSYRIHMEYSSGDKVNAFWYGNKVKDKAITAYNLIEHFFSPWRTQAAREGRIQAHTERVASKQKLYEKVSAAVSRKKAYPELKQDVQDLKYYFDFREWKDDVDADKRGDLPSDLRRDVLDKDKIYDLLRSPVLKGLLAE